MNSSPRLWSCWIAFASSAAVLVLAAPAHAFTDGNAELKEAASAPAARVVVTGKSALPVRTVWVPPTAKSMDAFKPVLPENRVLAPSGSQSMAKAEPAAVAKR